MAQLGRKSIFQKKTQLVNALRAVKGQEGFAFPSRYLQHRMANEGLVEFFDVRSGKRGRPRQAVRVTRKGQSYINFSK